MLARAGGGRHGPTTVAVTEGTNFALTVAGDGTTVIDVQGALWMLPPGQTAGHAADGWPG